MLDFAKNYKLNLFSNKSFEKEKQNLFRRSSMAKIIGAERALYQKLKGAVDHIDEELSSVEREKLVKEFVIKTLYTEPPVAEYRNTFITSYEPT